MKLVLICSFLAMVFSAVPTAKPSKSPTASPVGPTLVPTSGPTFITGTACNSVAQSSGSLGCDNVYNSYYYPGTSIPMTFCQDHLKNKADTQWDTYNIVIRSYSCSMSYTTNSGTFTSSSIDYYKPYVPIPSGYFNGWSDSLPYCSIAYDLDSNGHPLSTTHTVTIADTTSHVYAIGIMGRPKPVGEYTTESNRYWKFGDQVILCAAYDGVYQSGICITGVVSDIGVSCSDEINIYGSPTVVLHPLASAYLSSNAVSGQVITALVSTTAATTTPSRKLSESSYFLRGLNK